MSSYGPPPLMGPQGTPASSITDSGISWSRVSISHKVLSQVWTSCTASFCRCQMSCRPVWVASIRLPPPPPPPASLSSQVPDELHACAALIQDVIDFDQDEDMIVKWVWIRDLPWLRLLPCKTGLWTGADPYSGSHNSDVPTGP